MRLSLSLGRLVIAGAAAITVTVAIAGTVAAQPARPAPQARAAQPAFRLSQIKHVWVIQVENEGYTQSFGKPAVDPYLARTLPREGALLTNYYSIGHHSLDNYIAEISGQAPNTLSQEDCPKWAPLPDDIVGPYHQVLDTKGGCVFPASVQTLGNQLSAKKLSWKAYLEDMGNDPSRDKTVNTPEGPACGHPATGAVDLTQHASKTDQYAVRHEGFMYFRSVTENEKYCEAHLLSLRPLKSDLSAASKTPAFSWITPNLCDDGHDSPCVTGAPGGLKQIDAFLEKWVPVIMASPAYKQGGLILITFDEGSTDTACCGESSGPSSSHPNTPLPGLGGPGGGPVGRSRTSSACRT